MPPGRRSGRAAAKKAAAALETAPKGFEDVQDESMLDADATRDDDDDKDPEHVEEPDDADDDDKPSKAEDSGNDADGPDDSAAATPKEPSPPPQPMVRRKRLGRPPKNKPPDWDPMISVPADEVRDTPRRRGRGGWRGRGGRKGGAPPPKAEQVIDAEGTIAEIVDDECLLPDDPEGEEKVDKLGNLQGGRDYRCRVFTVLGRGERLYMLSTEPARCVGFRDSYLFFTKHRKLHKIIVDDDEKRDMIEREIIPHSYKGRSIGIVTARSVFREFGARIVVGGKRILDDYNVAQARADGAVEGQVADPDDKFIPGQPYNKNQYVAWHGASAVYHTNTPAAPVPAGKPEYKRRKVNVNDVNWMFEHAREASLFNSGISAVRKLNSAGVYDIHTNVIQYPASLQPTIARIEQVAPEDEDSVAATAGGKFPPVPPRMARNLYIADTYMETAPSDVAGATSKDDGQADFLASFNGLEGVSDDIKDLLPPECRTAFDKALDSERQWKTRWGPESQKMCRREPLIDKAIVP